MNKTVIFSAPSGSGKTTIIQALLKIPELRLGFCISTTSRAPRGKEVHGQDYYFISAEEFQEQIQQGKFLEWEEVYPGTFYGTYKSEVQRLFGEGKNIIFDLDVYGGINVKKHFGERSLSIFVQPPSLEELRKRLENRQTDSPEKIEIRLAKAQQEMNQAPNFDIILINDQLSEAITKAEKTVKDFLMQ